MEIVTITAGFSAPIASRESGTGPYTSGSRVPKRQTANRDVRHNCRGGLPADALHPWGPDTGVPCPHACTCLQQGRSGTDCWNPRVTVAATASGRGVGYNSARALTESDWVVGVGTSGGGRSAGDQTRRSPRFASLQPIGRRLLSLYWRLTHARDSAGLFIIAQGDHRSVGLSLRHVKPGRTDWYPDTRRRFVSRCSSWHAPNHSAAIPRAPLALLGQRPSCAGGWCLGHRGPCYPPSGLCTGSGRAARARGWVDSPSW